MDYRNGNADIYLYNLLSNEEKALVTNSSSQTEPDVYGDKVVWVDNRYGSDDIFLYDLSNGYEQWVPDYTTVKGSPAIWKNKIVWHWETGNLGVYNISVAEFDVLRASSGVKADVNRDGRTDSIVLYNCGNKTASLWVFLSDGTKFTPRLFWKSDPGAFDANRAQITAVDVNRDGKADAIVL